MAVAREASLVVVVTITTTTRHLATRLYDKISKEGDV